MYTVKILIAFYVYEISSISFYQGTKTDDLQSIKLSIYLGTKAVDYDVPVDDDTVQLTAFFYNAGIIFVSYPRNPDQESLVLGSWSICPVCNNICIQESFNTIISHKLFDYTITFVNSQH